LIFEVFIFSSLASPVKTSIVETSARIPSKMSVYNLSPITQVSSFFTLNFSIIISRISGSGFPKTISGFLLAVFSITDAIAPVSGIGPSFEGQFKSGFVKTNNFPLETKTEALASFSYVKLLSNVITTISGSSFSTTSWPYLEKISFIAFVPTIKIFLFPNFFRIYSAVSMPAVKI